MKQTTEMNDASKFLTFDIEYFQGTTCVGCAMIADLAINVPFANQQIELMRQLVSQVDEELYSEGILPVLKDSAPELYVKINDAARSAIFDFLVISGIHQGYIELDEYELQRNFALDVKDGTFDFFDGDLFECDEPPTEEELNEKKYNAWYEEEMSRVHSESLSWIRSRYSVDNQVEMPENLIFTCDIPVELLPED
jgi:hypothetical protein